MHRRETGNAFQCGPSQGRSFMFWISPDFYRAEEVSWLPWSLNHCWSRTWEKKFVKVKMSTYTYVDLSKKIKIIIEIRVFDDSDWSSLSMLFHTSSELLKELQKTFTYHFGENRIKPFNFFLWLLGGRRSLQSMTLWKCMYSEEHRIVDEMRK